jgi:hypothetical protein
VNKVLRFNPPHYTFYCQIGHQINECPFIENNVRQGFVEYFQDLNLELVRVEDHRDFELKDMYDERFIID